jgi:lysozyme
MQPSATCYSLIKHFEGLYLTAYLDAVDVPTIGYGTIIYPNGIKVKTGDHCTEQEAQEYLEFEVNQKAAGVQRLLKEIPVNQNQFDSLVSFTYNLGIEALHGSTLLKKLLINPHDPTIYKYEKDTNGDPMVNSCEFLKWVHAGHKILSGLVVRRAREAHLYGTP